MHALVVYESMFGNTRHVADAIAAGLGEVSTVRIVNTADTADPLTEFDLAFDLVVVGGPTHVHGMSLPRTRAEATRWAADPRHDVQMDDEAPGDGVREWLEALPRSTAMAAAFDTRSDIPRILSGAASARIDRDLEHHGLRSISAPMSFLVDGGNHLVDLELDRARAWGSLIGRTALAADETAGESADETAGESADETAGESADIGSDDSTDTIGGGDGPAAVIGENGSIDR